MRVTGLHIERFGIWSNLTMKDLPEGMTVFFGPNEAGKSTLMQFVRTMLYGFHPDRCARFVADRKKHGTFIQPDGRLGGVLFVASKDGDFQIRRYADESDPLGSPGEVRLTSQDGSRHGAQRLGTLLCGIDDTIYTNVFAVGLQEMQAISALQDTQAARQLYSLTTGADRVSLVDIMRQLRATQSRLVGGEDRRSLLAELVQQRDRLQAEISQHQPQQERWARMVAERDGLNDEMARLEKAAEESLRRTDLTEFALRMQPNWEEVRRLDREIQMLGNVPVLSPRILQGLEAATREIESIEQQLQALHERRAKLRERLAAVPRNEAVQRNAARIAVALEQRPAIVGLDDRLSRVTSERDELEFEIQAEQERLGLVSEGDSAGLRPRLEPVAIESLQEPARMLERTREQLEITKKEASGYKEDARRIARELALALGRPPDEFEKSDREEIRVALEASSSVAAGLKRRADIDREIAKVKRLQAEAADERADIVASQLLPWELVRAIGVLFAAGTMMFLSGLFGHSFGWSDQWRGLLLVAGGIATGLAVLLKISLDQPVQDGVREATRQGELLTQRLRDLKEELARLDESLPQRHQSAESLRDSRTDIVRLEALMPLEEQRRHAIRLAEEAERRAVDIARSMKDARARWEQALGSLGLSTKLTPAQMSALSGQTGSLHRLHARMDDLQLEEKRVQQEQANARERIRDLLHDMQVRQQATSAVDSLNQLARTLEEHEESLKLIESLRDEERQLKREIQSLARNRRQWDRRRDRAVAAAGAADMADLERMREQAARRRTLTQARDELQAALQEALGADARARSVTQELEEAVDGNLTTRLQRARTEFDKVAARLKEVQYRQGELDEQIRQLAADRTLTDLHLRVGIVQHQLDDCVRRWQVVNTIGGMLKTVYKKYEKERQPETLKEASQFLERMTGGKYCRIWTPLSEDVLLVDDRDGRSAPIELLSRGTREQLFLSLRLALITNYANRGVRMPLILDDVLVNFDAERTAAAAALLVDFARSGYQTLVFTCHQHIRELFEQLQVDVRELPRHGGRAKDDVMAVSAADGKKAKRKGKPVVVLGFADQLSSGERPSPSYASDWWQADLLPVHACDTVLLGYQERSTHTTGRPSARDAGHPSGDERSPFGDPSMDSAAPLAVAEDNGSDHPPSTRQLFSWLDYVDPLDSETNAPTIAEPSVEPVRAEFDPGGDADDQTDRPTWEQKYEADDAEERDAEQGGGEVRDIEEADQAEDLREVRDRQNDLNEEEDDHAAAEVDDAEDELEEKEDEYADVEDDDADDELEEAEVDDAAADDGFAEDELEEEEYEYVDVDEAGDGEDDEYEYEYVYVDEEGREISVDELEEPDDDEPDDDEPDDDEPDDDEQDDDEPDDERDQEDDEEEEVEDGQLGVDDDAPDDVELEDDEDDEDKVDGDLAEEDDEQASGR